MNTTDTLTLKALQLKQSISGGANDGHMIDHLIDTHPAETKESMRNICAFISKDLFSSVEQTCNNLDLTKRQLIEMALIDIIDKSKEIMARHDVFEGLDNQEEA